MSFFSALAFLGICGVPVLAIAAFVWSRYSTMHQSISDAERVSVLAEKFGVPAVLLIFTGFVLWRLAKWTGPKADKLIDITLTKADALPKLLEENAERANAQQARDLAVLQALERIANRLEALTEILKMKK